MSERIAHMTPEDERGSGRHSLSGLDEAMGAQFDLEGARFEVQALVEATEDAERLAQGLGPKERTRNIIAPEGFSGMGVTPRGW